MLKDDRQCMYTIFDQLAHWYEWKGSHHHNRLKIRHLTSGPSAEQEVYMVVMWLALTATRLDQTPAHQPLYDNAAAPLSPLHTCKLYIHLILERWLAGLYSPFQNLCNTTEAHHDLSRLPGSRRNLTYDMRSFAWRSPTNLDQTLTGSRRPLT